MNCENTRSTLGVCETCFERGRPNEPAYKMGMCTFCYHGLPHPKATKEQLAREKMGAQARERLRPLSRRESAAPSAVAGEQGNQKNLHECVIEEVASRNGRP